MSRRTAILVGKVTLLALVLTVALATPPVAVWVAVPFALAAAAVEVLVR